MSELGYNSVRLILEYVVWEKEHDVFLNDFDKYLTLCAKYGISCMIVLANDCMPPKTELWKMPDIGEQHYDVGYHGGRKHSQHGGHSCPAPHYYLDDEKSREKYFEMVKEIVTIYKDDPHAPIDFTKWFHDLYRPSHRPYDPRETELIRKFCTLADREFEKRSK